LEGSWGTLRFGTAAAPILDQTADKLHRTWGHIAGDGKQHIKLATKHKEVHVLCPGDISYLADDSVMKTHKLNILMSHPS